MKTTEIIGEGHCGLTVELNLMDQYAVNHVIERKEAHDKQVAEHKEWESKKSAAINWKTPQEERNAWHEANPEPELEQWSWEDEMAPIFVFLKKLALSTRSMATIFEEEK